VADGYVYITDTTSPKLEISSFDFPRAGTSRIIWRMPCKCKPGLSPAIESETAAAFEPPLAVAEQAIRRFPSPLAAVEAAARYINHPEAQVNLARAIVVRERPIARPSHCSRPVIPLMVRVPWSPRGRSIRMRRPGTCRDGGWRSAVLRQPGGRYWQEAASTKEDAHA
jgi:hypothetical protein